MRQVLITRSGPPDVLRVVDAPLPDPKAGEVRIRVAAAGVNFADVMGRLGIESGAPKIPFVPGHEVAGVIDAVGAGVDAARLGENVIALARVGGYSEYLCVPVEQTFLRPAEMPVEKAAGFALAYLTAYEALIVLAGIKPGEHVLIHQAAGGVGLAAVGISKIFGATIYGTASAHKHAALRAQGVQYPIDYHHVDFEREVKQLTSGRGVQIALDPVGGRSWLKSYRVLSAGGRLVMCGASSLAPGQRRSIRAALRLALTIPWFRFNPIALTSDNKGVLGINLAYLWGEQAMLRGWADQVLAWYREGRLDVCVDRVFTFAQAADAHRYMQERRNIGKLILVPG
jgi:NADPH:quinone reductase-like Zn-dependent oxidoreductase